jgi:hypothetical protein
MRPTSPAAIRRLLAVCALIATLALPACGSSSPAAPGKKNVTSEQETTTADVAKQRPKGPAHAPSCEAQLGDFLDSLDRLRIRLASGLSYQQYAAAVKRIRTTYEDLPIDTLSPDCLIASGTPGEKAFNRYIEAANNWGECLADVGCNGEVVEPELQREWQVASHWLSEAQAGLG